MQHQRHLQSERDSSVGQGGEESGAAAAASSSVRARRARQNFCGCHGITVVVLVVLVVVTSVLTAETIQSAGIDRRVADGEAFEGGESQKTREDSRDVLPRSPEHGLRPKPPEARPEDLDLQKNSEAAQNLKLCADWLKRYEIKPDESWGSAPKDVQEAWGEKVCDRVLGEEGFSFDDPPTRGRSRAVVFVWTSLKGWLEYLRPEFVKTAREECPTECVFTNDLERLDVADAVFFHASTHSRKNFPTRKPPGVKYVFVNLEPITYKGVAPLLMDHKYMSRFDLSMTYQRSSSVPLGYVSGSPAQKYFESEKLSFQEKDGFGEPSAIAAFVSNCKLSGAMARTAYMTVLMQHMAVHSYGKCNHNREEPVIVTLDGTTSRQNNKIEVLRRYKFLMAFENNDKLTDYVTEKVYNGLQAGTLPVYWGADNVEHYVPRGSVVKASDFESPAALAAYLKGLAEDEEAYESYFRWRGNATEMARFQEEVVSHSAYSVNAMCRLCDRLVRGRGDVAR